MVDADLWAEDWPEVTDFCYKTDDWSLLYGRLKAERGQYDVTHLSTTAGNSLYDPEAKSG